MPDVTVSLTVKTCKCGSVYAVPHWIGDYDHTCPMCAKKQIREANERTQEAYDDGMRKGHQIASLRGVITRLKRASKGRS